MTRRTLLGLSLAVGIAACGKSKPAPGAEVSSSPTPPTQTPTSEAACRASATQANASVHWVTDTALNADLNYDGGLELVVWGTEGDSLFVFAIVECAGQGPGRVWSFPIRALAAFGTVDLSVSLVNPAFGEGYLIENCMGAETTSGCRHLAALDKRLAAAYQRGGRGLMVGVPDQHNVHLYWDSESNQFVTWGL